MIVSERFALRHSLPGHVDYFGRLRLPGSDDHPEEDLVGHDDQKDIHHDRFELLILQYTIRTLQSRYITAMCII